MQKESILDYKGLLATVGILVLVLVGVFVFIYHSDNLSNNTNSSASSNKLVIKDLGAEITLPASLTGTTVETQASQTSGKSTLPPIVNLKLEQYSILVNRCLGSKYTFATPYASLTKISGKAMADDTQLMKQFNGFYIERIGSGLKLTCKDPSIQATFDSQTSKYNQALKDAFASAQPI